MTFQRTTMTLLGKDDDGQPTYAQMWDAGLTIQQATYTGRTRVVHRSITIAPELVPALRQLLDTAPPSAPPTSAQTPAVKVAGHWLRRPRRSKS